MKPEYETQSYAGCQMTVTVGWDIKTGLYRAGSRFNALTPAAIFWITRLTTLKTPLLAKLP